MKYTLLGFMIMTIFSSSQATANEDSKNESAIKTIVESVAVLADLGEFYALEKLYADKVRLDYTSLSGGEVETKSPKELMTTWASVLPGFDLTRHDISNIVVTVKGNKAKATTDVTADHYVNDLFWQVKGNYDYEFQKKGNKWQITNHTFNLKHENGTRDVFGPVSENAAKNPSSYILKQKAKNTVSDFLTSLEEKDMEKFASVWAEDAVQDMPFSPEGFPKKVVGKNNLINHYSSWPEISGKASFTDELMCYPMSDANWLFCEWKGDVEILTTNKNYNQTYGGLFHINNGKIRLFREYYDPIVFKTAFGLVDKLE